MFRSIASFLTHCLATGWSAFQLVSTQRFRSDFTRLATRGACQGVNLLPTYWTERAQFEIPTLAFNALALLISGVLSWKLMKVREIQIALDWKLTVGCSSVVRMANLQAYRCIIDYQPGVPHYPHLLHHHPAFCLLRCRLSRAVD